VTSGRRITSAGASRGLIAGAGGTGTAMDQVASF
jgi:hypothetical protein